jgi:diguanylate cyclase (GGDEF)-like protein/PAS domain S-box-containing protein
MLTEFNRGIKAKVYSSIIENSPNIITIYDLITETFVEVNKIFCKKMGYTKKEILGKSRNEVKLLPNNSSYNDFIDVIGSEQSVKNIHINLMSKNGKKFRGLFSGEVYENNDHKFLTTIITDLSNIEKNDYLSRYNKEYLYLILKELSNAIWVINRKGIIQDVNDKAAIDTGYSKKELIGMSIEDLDITLEKGTFNEMFFSKNSDATKKYIGKQVKKDGSIIDIEASSIILEIDGESLLIATTRDITKDLKHESDLLKAKKTLKEQKKKLEIQNNQLIKSVNRNNAIVNVLPDMLFIYDRQGNLLDCQTNDSSNLIEKKEIFIGKNLRDVLPNPIYKKAIKSIEKTLSNDSVESFDYCLNFNGKKKHFETRMVKSETEEVLAIIRDITSRKKEEELIMKLSYRDQLTGLYNRQYFDQYLIDLEEESYLPISIIMLDVNGLKLTNDAFGLLVGDQLLMRVSEIILELCPENATIARIGGDEFAIVIKDMTNEDSERLVDQIYERVNNEKVENVIVSVSIGWESRINFEASLRDIYIKAENHMFRKKLSESQSMRHQTIKAIVESLNEKNKREKEHSEHVSVLAGKTAKAMGLSDQKVKEIQMTGLLHDIGKIAIREKLLNKKGKLTTEEYEEIKRHPESGYQILKSVDAYSSIAEDILSHHERYDGLGYPKGLKGKEIPLVARIISIADAYDAMVSNRSYRMGMTQEAALKEIIEHAGTQFDPIISEIFVAMMKEEN